MVVYRRVTLEQAAHVGQELAGLLNERELNGAQRVVVARQSLGEEGADGLDHGLRASDVLRLGQHVTRLFVDEQQRHGEGGDVELRGQSHDVLEPLQQRGQALLSSCVLLVGAEVEHDVAQTEIGVARDEHIAWLECFAVPSDLLQLLLDVVKVKFSRRVAEGQELCASVSGTLCVPSDTCHVPR